MELVHIREDSQTASFYILNSLVQTIVAAIKISDYHRHHRHHHHYYH